MRHRLRSSLISPGDESDRSGRLCRCQRPVSERRQAVRLRGVLGGCGGSDCASGSRERRRLRSSLNHVRRLARSLIQHRPERFKRQVQLHMALTPPECSTFMSPGQREARRSSCTPRNGLRTALLEILRQRLQKRLVEQVTRTLMLPHLLNGLTSIQAEVIGQCADEVGAERSTRPFQRPASRVSKHE